MIGRLQSFDASSRSDRPRRQSGFGRLAGVGHCRQHGIDERVDTSVVIVSDKVDLGFADLDRQLIKATDSGGRPAYGLREIFTAK